MNQADTVRKHGAKRVFFMSCACADKPEITQELAEAHTQAGNDNDGSVIPAGLAFARSIAARRNALFSFRREPTRHCQWGDVSRRLCALR